MVVWKHALNPDEQRSAMINRGDCRVEYCVENFRAKHIHRVTAQNPDFSETLRLASFNTSAWRRQRRRASTASTLGCNFFFSYLRKCDILKAPINNKYRRTMKMATIEELVKQYHEDPEFKKEVQDILADGQITIDEFMSFAKKHKVNVTLFDLPIVIAEAKKRGLL
jgi:hypothetical protein